MRKDFSGEKWKTVTFNFDYTNDYRIEVSNFGRLRTFNKVSDGNILKGSMINGYRIIRLKFFKPRSAETENSLLYLQKQCAGLAQHIKQLKLDDKDPQKIEESIQLLDSLKKNISKKFAADLKERTINYHSLVHRLVAQYFCNKPSEEHTVVAHLDFDKLNNRSTNLKWMIPAENFAHQQNSPIVIEERKDRIVNRKADSKVSKLTVTKVMLLKKLLNQGKPLRTLVKQFKITDTQILRIKRGENWGDIEAAC